MLGDHLCPLTCVQKSLISRGTCAEAVSAQQKAMLSPQSFSWSDEGRGMRPEQWHASHSPAGFLPAPLGQSQPSAATQKRQKKKKKKSERFAKTHSLYLLPKKDKRKLSSWSDTEFWRHFCVTSPRSVINSWIVGWLVLWLVWGGKGVQKWKIANISRHLPHARPTVMPSKSLWGGLYHPYFMDSHCGSETK